MTILAATQPLGWLGSFAVVLPFFVLAFTILFIHCRK